MVSQCLNQLRYRLSPSQFVHRTVPVQTTKENYDLLTGFDVPFTVFCDVCYIQFVPTVLLDLSCGHLKYFAAVHVHHHHHHHVPEGLGVFPVP